MFDLETKIAPVKGGLGGSDSEAIRPKPYLTTLTPLRGIAAIIVVIFHSNLILKTFVPRGESNFLWAGWLWVDFFFILSGFILSYVYSDTFTISVSKSKYWKYIGARFARIYPLHLFTLIWSLLCTLLIRYYAAEMDPFYAALYNPEATPSALLLIQSLGLYRTPPLNTPSWSLSTEWWSYMIFPLLVPLFSRLKGRGKVITLLLIIGLYLIIKFVLGPIAQPFPNGTPTLNVTADFGILRCIAGFVLGMLLFELYKIKFAFKLLKRSSSFAIFSVGVVAAMVWGADDIIAILFFPLIILTAAYNTTTLKKVLSTKPLQLLGEWSFSIYMVHVPIIQTFIIFMVKNDPLKYVKFPAAPNMNHSLGLIYCVVLVVLTLIVASFTYSYIEVPARNYLNSLFKYRRPDKITEL